MEDDINKNRRRPQKMEDDLKKKDERRTQKKMEEDLKRNGRSKNKWKTSSSTIKKVNLVNNSKLT
jgi:hypothetical protein